MASNLSINDIVYVPQFRVNGSIDGSSALIRVTVKETNQRSARVSLPGGGVSDFIATSAILKDGAVMILRIGDFVTETSLLDPLSKSVLQYLRLLLPDDMVRVYEIRSTDELSIVWQQNHNGFSYVVLIGHGSKCDITFGVGGGVTANTLSTLLAVPNVQPKIFVSLCCLTGYAAFGQQFSKSSVCRELIAPYHSVHGAVASQFLQSYFAYHFLQGETSKVAFRHARKNTPGAVNFRCWKQGKLLAVTASKGTDPKAEADQGQ